MILLRILGGLFVAIGAVGLFLPVWPTTIFWIIAALFFARSSPAARDWIYSRPGIGRIVEAFVEHGIISRRSKIAASLGMVGFGLIGLWFAKSSALLASVLSLSLLIGLLFVWTRPIAQPESEL